MCCMDMLEGASSAVTQVFSARQSPMAEAEAQHSRAGHRGTFAAVWEASRNRPENQSGLLVAYSCCSIHSLLASPIFSACSSRLRKHCTCHARTNTASGACKLERESSCLCSLRERLFFPTFAFNLGQSLGSVPQRLLWRGVWLLWLLPGSRLEIDNTDFFPLY